jgi:hypothetical protein
MDLTSEFPELGTVSDELVRQCRIQLDLHFLPMRPECHMSDANMQFRISWCEQQEGRDWGNVIFTDESWFEVGLRKHWIWRRHDDYGPDVCYSRQAHPQKIMVWGGIGFNFKSELHFVTQGTVDGAYYLNNIISGTFHHQANRAYGDGAWLLQQDNARPHIKKDVVKAIEDLGIHILKPWPPYSPDLNIIERIWAIMKNRIETSAMSSLEHLREVLVEVWESLTYRTINNLVAEMPRRMRQVRHNLGRTIQRFTID